MGLISRLLGIDDIVREVLRVSAAQAEATQLLVHLMDRMQTCWFDPSPPPEPRRINDEIEALMYESGEEDARG